MYVDWTAAGWIAGAFASASCLAWLATRFARPPNDDEFWQPSRVTLPPAPPGSSYENARYSFARPEPVFPPDDGSLEVTMENNAIREVRLTDEFRSLLDGAKSIVLARNELAEQIIVLTNLKNVDVNVAKHVTGDGVVENSISIKIECETVRPNDPLALPPMYVVTLQGRQVVVEVSPLDEAEPRKPREAL